MLAKRARKAASTLTFGALHGVGAEHALEKRRWQRLERRRGVGSDICCVGDVEAARVHTLGEVHHRLLASPTNEEIGVRVQSFERLLLDFWIVIADLRPAEEHLYIARPQLTRKRVEVQIIPHIGADARYLGSPVGHGVGERRKRVVRLWHGDIVCKDTVRDARSLERGGNARDAERNRRVARARVEQIDEGDAAHESGLLFLWARRGLVASGCS